MFDFVPTGPRHRTVVVIGAGLCGLAAAVFLRGKGYHVHLMEKEDSIGGQWRQLAALPVQPDVVLDHHPAVTALLQTLSLAHETRDLRHPDGSLFILRDGRLLPLPASLSTLFMTPLLSAGAKLRLLKEPFIPGNYTEESAKDFSVRRFGSEPAEWIIEPWISGLLAGNAAELSAEYTLPLLSAWEFRSGSILKAMLTQSSFAWSTVDGGLSAFLAACARELGESVHLQCRVEHVIPARSGKHPIYTVTFQAGEERQSIEAGAVLFASPAYATAEIIRPLDPEFARAMQTVGYAPVGCVVTRYGELKLPERLRGMGVLVAPRQGCKTLSAFWPSGSRSSAAESGNWGITAYFGGVRNPGLLAESDEKISAAILEEIASLIGIRSKPIAQYIARWQQGIPQYHLGYGKLLKEMSRFEENFAGTALCGSYREGQMPGQRIAQARATADAIDEYLKRW